ncbi:MAG: DUF6456 domain-containing protein [Neorhizobium sp.]|nr:DUF6456 domain-containing protein [Neorhizobium sp.]
MTDRKDKRRKHKSSAPSPAMSSVKAAVSPQAAHRQHPPKRALVALIKLVVAAPRKIMARDREAQGGEGMRLAGSGDRQWPVSLVDHALSIGLVEIDGDMIRATNNARTFLRRALSDVDEAFLAQHGEIATGSADIDGQRQPVRRNLDDSPLSSVARLKDRDGRRYLPQEAIDAGERLASDFTRGQLQPRITASWQPRLSARSRGATGIPSGQGDMAESAIEARRRFGEAVEALGPELSGVAVDVCCFAKGLELIERERQWPVRSAKLMLRAALLSLARHYAPPPARPARRVHRWGDEDYRPKTG